MIPANKHRYFRKHNPKDGWENAIRVKYMGNEKVIADVWDWDQNSWTFCYTREISLSLKQLERYRELIDPAEIRLRFTDTYKKIKSVG